MVFAATHVQLGRLCSAVEGLRGTPPAEICRSAENDNLYVGLGFDEIGAQYSSPMVLAISWSVIMSRRRGSPLDERLLRSIIPYAAHIGSQESILSNARASWVSAALLSIWKTDSVGSSPKFNIPGEMQGHNTRRTSVRGFAFTLKGVNRLVGESCAITSCVNDDPCG